MMRWKATVVCTMAVIRGVPSVHLDVRIDYYHDQRTVMIMSCHAFWNPGFVDERSESTSQFPRDATQTYDYHKCAVQ